MIWNYDEMNKVITMKIAGFTYDEIGDTLKRSGDSIRFKINSIRKYYVDGDTIEEMLKRIGLQTINRI
jgi:DNA-binding CsgD family transcriptional regulator